MGREVPPPRVKRQRVGEVRMGEGLGLGKVGEGCV